MGRKPKFRNKKQIMDETGVGEDRLNSILARLKMEPVMKDNTGSFFDTKQVNKIKYYAKH